MSQLWWNPQILGFFFTDQAKSTLAELLDKSEDAPTALEQIEDYADSTNTDADALGDMFHDMSVEELAEEFGIDLEDDAEEEEDEDEGDEDDRSEKPWDCGKHFD